MGPQCWKGIKKRPGSLAFFSSSSMASESRERHCSETRHPRQGSHHLGCSSAGPMMESTVKTALDALMSPFLLESWTVWLTSLLSAALLSRADVGSSVRRNQGSPSSLPSLSCVHGFQPSAALFSLSGVSTNDALKPSSFQF